MKKKITILSLSFIGAAILWFICLVASQLFFDGEVFSKGISSFVWRFLIILLIVGFSGLLLLTSVSIHAENKPHIKLGEACGGLEIPYSLLETIKAKM